MPLFYRMAKHFSRQQKFSILSEVGPLARLAGIRPYEWRLFLLYVCLPDGRSHA